MSHRKKKERPASNVAPRARLQVEALEERWVPSANQWTNPELVTLSFTPDDTVLGSTILGDITSDLQSKFTNLFGSSEAWQNEFLEAAQQFAAVTNLNFAVVSDNGDDIGSGDYQQGDPNFGDIRVGGYNFLSTTVAQAYAPPPVNNYSIAGDIQFNTGTVWSISGGLYDVYTVSMHEVGHALGLSHNWYDYTSAMYPYYLYAKSGLASSDVSAIQAIYGTRDADSFDATASNGTFATASDITGSIDTGTKTALLNSLDLTSNSDVDYYKFTLPTGSESTLNIKVQSEGLSLMTPKVTVYDSSENVVATADGAGNYGATLELTVDNVSEAETYYVRVEGSTSDAFGIGSYGLAINVGTGETPEITPPDTQEENGWPISSGGGEALKLDGEFQVNTSSSGTQADADVGIDKDGNFVVVWETNHDAFLGLGRNVYFQKFDSDGKKLGNETRVNQTTLGYQDDAQIAMHTDGSFLVVWESLGQDGSGNAIYARTFNADGTASGNEFLVNSFTNGEQGDPDVALAGDGSFVIAWESYGQESGNNSLGVFAQRFDAAGTKLGSEFQVNQYVAGNQDDVMIASSDEGDFVVVWESWGQDGSGNGVYGRRYDSEGVALGDEFRVSSHTTGSQDDLGLDMDHYGNFVIVWESYGQDGSSNGVYAQRYADDGTKQGGEFLVNTETIGSQEDVAVAMDSHGNFMITWSSYGQDGSGWGIYSQQYGAGGRTIGNEIQVNTTTSGNQRWSSIALNEAGNAVVVWDGKGPADTTGIVGQRYNINAASGMHNMEGADGYGPVGTPHDHDHHDHDHHGHDHHGHDHAHGHGHSIDDNLCEPCSCASCTAAIANFVDHGRSVDSTAQLGGKSIGLDVDQSYWSLSTSLETSRSETRWAVSEERDEGEENEEARSQELSNLAFAALGTAFDRIDDLFGSDESSEQEENDFADLLEESEETVRS